MIPDDYLSRKEKIESEIEKLKEEARALQARHRAPALDAILKAMREYDIEPEEVASAWRSATQPSRRTRSHQPVPPKYRDPDTGQTWSGRGRTPRWLAAAEAQGQNRDDFLIKD